MKISAETTGAASSNMCLCVDDCTGTPDIIESEVSIKTIEDYLLYKNECVPSKEKRLKNRRKRKKRR